MLFSRRMEQNWIYISPLPCCCWRRVNTMEIWHLQGMGSSKDFLRFRTSIPSVSAVRSPLVSFFPVGTNIYATYWNPVTFQFVWYFLLTWRVTSDQYQQPDTNMALQIHRTAVLICNHSEVVGKEWFAIRPSLDRSVTPRCLICQLSVSVHLPLDTRRLAVWQCYHSACCGHNRNRWQLTENRLKWLSIKSKQVDYIYLL